MVSTEEILEKSENGLLVCVNCDYSYTLEPGESPEDFILKCNCGGKLNYFKPRREIITKKKSFAEKKSSQNKLKKRLGTYTCIFACTIAGVLILMDEMFFGIILLICIGFIGARLYSSGETNGKSWNKGIVGEKTVARYLNQLPENYFIFNDVKFPGSYGNLDHVVIGPNGIFVIETKNYGGFYIVKDDEWYYKNGKYVKKARSQPGTQVMRNAMSLKNFLVNNNIKMNGVWIDPIVTLVNKNFEIDEKPEYYKVLYPSAIPKYIKNQNHNIDLKILQKAVDLLAPYSYELSYLDMKGES